MSVMLSLLFNNATEFTSVKDKPIPAYVAPSVLTVILD